MNGRSCEDGEKQQETNESRWMVRQQGTTTTYHIKLLPVDLQNFITMPQLKPNIVQGLLQCYPSKAHSLTSSQITMIRYSLIRFWTVQESKLVSNHDYAFGLKPPLTQSKIIVTNNIH